MRSDIHNLFDAGHLRISPEGVVILSELASKSLSYKSIPEKIEIPNYVDPEAVRKRFEYS